MEVVPPKHTQDPFHLQPIDAGESVCGLLSPAHSVMSLQINPWSHYLLHCKNYVSSSVVKGLVFNWAIWYLSFAS